MLGWKRQGFRPATAAFTVKRHPITQYVTQ